MNSEMTSTKRKQKYFLLSGSGKIKERKGRDIEDISYPYENEIECTETMDKWDNQMLDQVQSGATLKGSY